MLTRMYLYSTSTKLSIDVWLYLDRPGSLTYFRGLCYSSGRAITGLSQSEDLRHLSVCREREISHREKKGRNPD